MRHLPSNLKATEIASELCVSSNTVRTHLRHIYAKLDAHTRGEAVQARPPRAARARPRLMRAGAQSASPMRERRTPGRQDASAVANGSTNASRRKAIWLSM